MQGKIKKHFNINNSNKSLQSIYNYHFFFFFAFDSFIYQTKAFLNQKIFDIILNQINPDYFIVFKGFF